MATISFNEHAPDEAVCFNFQTAAFTLNPGDTFETEDQRVVDEADTHPWLDVAVDTEAVTPRYRDHAPDPHHDPLSYDNPENQEALTTEAADEFEDARDAEEEAIFHADDQTVLPVPEPVDEEVVSHEDAEAEVADGFGDGNAPEAPAVFDAELPAEETPLEVLAEEPVIDPMTEDTI